MNVLRLELELFKLTEKSYNPYTKTVLYNDSKEVKIGALMKISGLHTLPHIPTPKLP